MPIRLCDNCNICYVIGVVPEPDTDSEHCRLCGQALESVSPEQPRDHVLRLGRMYAPETLDEENRRLREELERTRLRSQQLRRESRKGRQALDEQLKMSRAAREARIAPLD